MAYVLPQVLVFQDFQIVPAAVANPLRAYISGPHAQLVRFGEADEREDGALDYYDPLVDTEFAWPNRVAGGRIDFDYVSVWMTDALLRYHEDAIGAGSTVGKTAGYSNRIRSATRNYATNGDYARSSVFYDRDVTPGDVVRVRYVPTVGDPGTLWTYVKRLIGDPVAAVIGDATVDPANAETQVESASVEKTAGPGNCVFAAADGSAYDGLASGYVEETYRIRVVDSSSGGDHTTASLRVFSGSGEDDVDEVVPAAAGSPTAIGTRGLTVTFDAYAAESCSLSADNEEVSPDDLITGQEWTVTVSQAYTALAATSGGDYEEEESTVYVVTVTTGGDFTVGNVPRISVTTTTGTDISGPTLVSGPDTPVVVGTRGVTISFDGDSGIVGLRKGDRFYIEVTGVQEGPKRTIELGHSLPDDVADDSEVGIVLYIRKSELEIPQNRVGFAPEVNWEADSVLTIKSGIVAYDETWTDDGTPLPLDVVSEESKQFGKLYVTYRAWRQDLCREIGTIDDVADLDDLVSGPLDPDNPLKWGLFKALANANGVAVKYASVCDPDDPESWSEVLELALGRDDVYGFVPLTRNQDVLDLFAAHVNAMSTPEQGLWRTAWFNLAGLPEVPIVSAGSSLAGYTLATTSDGELALATIDVDPQGADDAYVLVTVPSGNSNFVTNEVRAGDIVRTIYQGDGFGNFTYSEFVVDSVLSEDQLLLLDGPAEAYTVPIKIEVWRNLTATEEATAIGIQAGTWANRRIRAVWPDTIDSGATVQQGYHLCAALAALAGGVLPQQGLTRLAVSGFTGVPRTVDKFNRSHLDDMAERGTWIVTQDLRSGEIHTRHAVTTGEYADINAREEMITRNVDSISYQFQRTFEPYIGVTNVVPTVRAQIESDTRLLVDRLKQVIRPQLGGQLTDATLVSVTSHAVFKDRFVVNLILTVPYATNNVEIHLLV